MSTENTMKLSLFKKILMINRSELIFSGVITVLWPLFLMVTSIRDIFSIKILLIVIACMLIRHAGFVLNVISDFELDKTNPRKKLITYSVESIGINKTKLLCVVEFAVILALLAFINVYYGVNNPYVYVVFVADILNLLLYNHKLTKFKGKGILNSVCMGFRTLVNTYLIELILMQYPSSLGINLAVLALAIDIGAGAIFIAMFDAESDKKFGLNTIPVKYGLLVAIRYAWVLKAFGAAILFYGWYLLSKSITLTLILIVIVNIGALIDYGLAIVKIKDLQGLFALFKRPDFRKHAFVWWGLCRMIVAIASLLYLFKL